MTDPVRSFELYVLRPLQLAILAVALVLGFQGLWLWLLAPVAAIFYLGIIGSKLHPFRNARGLAEGPLEGPTARFERTLVSPGMAASLVGHACTRVGILVALGVGLFLWAALGWRWYLALLASYILLPFVGGSLKAVFLFRRR